MKKVTKLKATKNGKRVSVFLDEEFSFAVDNKFIVDFKIYKGKKLDQKQIEKIRAKDFENKYYKKILKLILKRPRSEFEIRQYLKEKIYKKKSRFENLVENIIDKLKNEEYIDDEKFAKWWVRNRTKFKPRGKYLLRKELLSKGVSKKIIKKTLEESSLDDKEELRLAIKLGEKKYRLLGSVDSQKSKRKFMDYLLRKGFKYKTAKEVLKKIKLSKS